MYLLSKKPVIIGIVFIILFFVFLLFIYNNYILVNLNKMALNEYKKTIESTHTKIQKAILLKEKSTLALAITLSSNNRVADDMQRGVIPQDYYKKLIKLYKENTLYQNIWIQIIDEKGYSLYKSWTDERGDAIALKHKGLNLVKKKGEISTDISVGRYDFSINAMVPIFHRNKYLGILEVISHFNSIVKTLEHEKISSLVVATKEQTKKLTKPFSRHIVNGYYIANLEIDKKSLEIIKSVGFERLFQKPYSVIQNHIIVRYPLHDLNKKLVGYYLAFINDDFLDKRDLKFFQFKWLVFMLVFFLAFAIVGLFAIYYFVRKQKIYYKNILDSSKNIVIINDGKKIIGANKTFFSYFKKYNTLDSFMQEHKCICEYFQQEPGYLTRENPEGNWIEILLKNPKKSYKVKIKIDSTSYYFLISASIIDREKGHFVVVLADITQEELYKLELERLNITDPLTNLYNRRYYLQKIKEEIYLARRYKHPLSVIMFDIDFFKKVNDTYGHDKGDAVLKYYTGLIQKELRESDILCRIGGEEFFMILPHTELFAAEKIAEKLRKIVENSHEVIPITMSFGVAQYKEPEDEDKLFKRVDGALYKAKETGRNKVVLG